MIIITFYLKIQTIIYKNKDATSIINLKIIF